jgi:hypothetical protein
MMGCEARGCYLWFTLLLFISLVYVHIGAVCRDCSVFRKGGGVFHVAASRDLSIKSGFQAGLNYPCLLRSAVNSQTPGVKTCFPPFFAFSPHGIRWHNPQVAAGFSASFP